MKSNRVKGISLCFLIIVTSLSLFSQPSRHRSKVKRWLQKTVWTLGVSGVVVDDDGKQFKRLFDVKHTWNSIWIPSKADLDAFISKGWSVNASFFFSQLKAGKIISNRNETRASTENILAFDACAKYDLAELFGDTKALSPYLIGGFGYTYRNLPVPRQKNGLMGDFGVGFTIWFYKGFGFNTQSLAKFALNRGRNGTSNYLQHSIGIVYCFNVITGYRTPGRLGHRYNLFRN